MFMSAREAQEKESDEKVERRRRRERERGKGQKGRTPELCPCSMVSITRCTSSFSKSNGGRSSCLIPEGFKLMSAINQPYVCMSNMAHAQNTAQHMSSAESRLCKMYNSQSMRCSTAKACAQRRTCQRFKEPYSLVTDLSEH